MELLHVQKLSKVFKPTWIRTSFLKSMCRRMSLPETASAVVDQISFELEKGEALGILGPNGSGKTTLLRMIAGLLEPTSGSIACDSGIAPFFSWDIFYNNELAAADNVLLLCTLLGLPREEVKRDMETIFNRAGLRGQQLADSRSFSSGMKARIVFSIAMQTSAPILIMDEIFAGGDMEFHKQCIASAHKLLDQGRSLLIVTHDLDLLQQLTQRCLWLDHGRMQMLDASQIVIDAYQACDGVPLP
ncbi:ABC transporter ATP-binding protein [Planctomycetota bacterium]